MNRVTDVTTSTDDCLGIDGDDGSQKERWQRFGSGLTSWLARSQKTQTAVAKQIGVSTSTISAWKQGQAEPDRPEMTFALERALGAPAGELSRHLGYVPPDAATGSWEKALGLEPGQVDDRLREAIFVIVDAMKKLG